MADEKKKPKKVSFLNLFIAGGFAAIIGSGGIALSKQYNISDGYSITYNQDDLKEGSPIINKTINMQPTALIYSGPDNAIYGNEGKNPYFDLTKERTVVAAVYEIENDFEIIKDRLTEMTVINNGGELVAVQTKCDGEVEGYFRIFDIKNENQKDNQKVK